MYFADATQSELRTIAFASIRLSTVYRVFDRTTIFTWCTGIFSFLRTHRVVWLAEKRNGNKNAVKNLNKTTRSSGNRKTCKTNYCCFLVFRTGTTYDGTVMFTSCNRSFGNTAAVDTPRPDRRLTKPNHLHTCGSPTQSAVDWWMSTSMDCTSIVRKTNVLNSIFYATCVHKHWRDVLGRPTPDDQRNRFNLFSIIRISSHLLWNMIRKTNIQANR